MNASNRVLYTGVTNNLLRRMYEYREKFNSGFTSQYNVNKLVYYEIFDNVADAILREKQIKGGSRLKKLELVRRENSGFEDLYSKLL